MTAFRSLTDEQLAAKHDPEPWRARTRYGNENPNIRYKTADDSAASQEFMGDVIFDPRVECIPSRDPEPYKCTDGTRHANYCALGFPVRFVPRPEFARPPVNRVLVEYRKGEYNHDTDAWIWEGTDVTPAEIEHARKVINRLVGVYE